MAISSVERDYDICIGVITSAHGVKGNVKVHTFTARPSNVKDFIEIFDINGILYKLSVVSLPSKAGYLIAKIEGINSRNDAELLCHKKLYVKRSTLPAIQEEDEFYHADLYGMIVRSQDGEVIGTVQNILNYGANDILEVSDTNSEKVMLYPFNKQFVQQINIKERYLVLELLEEVVVGS
jgi:16S rRNA processing protein RimM